MTLTADWYQRQATISQNTARAIEKLWAQIDPDRITESWAELLPQATQLFSAGQLAAATQTNDYVSGSVRADGLQSDPVARTNPGAFAGLTADMLPVESLLTLPAIEAKQRIGMGASAKDALMSGRYKIIGYTSTEVQDAGRLSTSVSMTAEPKIKGYVRIVSAPACSRCIILAGKTYQWDAAFPRHPRCDCTQEPWTGGHTSDKGPLAAFNGMSEADQARVFGKAESQAIRDGADIYQVVNSRRGMSHAGAMTTGEGTTRRGAYSRRARANGRAEETVIKSNGRNVTRVTGQSERKSVRYCYWAANGDRAEALALLQKYAYIL